jgi:hypothetical protein
VRLAVQKGYQITEVYEEYGYNVTQYDPKTGEDEIFVQYIDTFLKLNPRLVYTPIGYNVQG